MKTEPPLLSIIIPVYNAGEYFSETVASLLNQTFVDFELIIVDDASTERVDFRSKQFDDSRIRLLRQSVNIGAPACRNYGINYSTGSYIAIHDADDLSVPTRFEQQINFMRVNDLDFCSTFVRPLRFRGKWRLGPTWSYQTRNPELGLRLLFDDPFVNSSVIFKRELLSIRRGPFLPEYDPCDDYEFYSLIGLENKVKMEIYPRVLVHYRQHSNQLTNTRRQDQIRLSRQIRRLNISRVGIETGHDMIEDYLSGLELANNKMPKENVREIISNFMISLKFIEVQLRSKEDLATDIVANFVRLCWYETLSALIRKKLFVASYYWKLTPTNVSLSYLADGIKLHLREVRYMLGNF